MNEIFSSKEINKALISRHGEARQKKFDSAVVGIAGLGGLGSHVAALLARLGIGHLVLVDFDMVDISNIHRQAYTLQDISKPKSLALKQFLEKINPNLIYEDIHEKINPENIHTIFNKCDIICEAFDEAKQKAMLTEFVLTKMPKKFLVGASGMAGIGNPNLIKAKKRFNNYFLCGDESSDVDALQTLYAPRVALCASLQATVIMQLILNELDI